jgi:hypothetical protein
LINKKAEEKRKLENNTHMQETFRLILLKKVRLEEEKLLQ